MRDKIVLLAFLYGLAAMSFVACSCVRKGREIRAERRDKE